ncbi:lipopolysaccharide biosynthesis protein [Aurantiacibacter poecillastricola]|uniref:lipopolysaccharide biosynthesis protein n=1 Tax=Aurantiacibacter poecillastricola TaxID=3064385 RepID=UPI00273D648E|nr:oligosaccharide flippase family protein [Aurantiacibacter sp. 219JJ12-13]MDP5261551.1 oligosaccharide flippase family protein [Aurantiacibacter sp. 219JJ12-13]
MIRRALQNTGWLMGARGINAVLSLVYLALATRALGVEGFGQFVVAFTFAQLVVGFTSFQTWQAIIRWGQESEGRKDATGFALALDAITIVVGTAVAASVLAFAGDWLPIPSELRVPTFLFTLASLLAIRSTPTGLLRLHDRYARAAAADATTSIMRAIGAAIVAILAPSITAFLVVWSIAELATAAMYWSMAARTEPVHWRRFSLLRVPRLQESSWSFVIGTSLTGMLTIASRQLLVLLVGALGGAALAGIYRVAAQLGEGLLKLAQALLRALYPELVRNPKQAKRLTSAITRIAVATGLAAVALAALAGDWLILVIAGEEFLPAYWPMIILAGAAAFELAGASLEALLVAHGRAIANFILRAVPTLASIAALPWLVEWQGTTGAALAVLVASIISVTGFVIATRRTSTKD